MLHLRLFVNRNARQVLRIRVNHVRHVSTPSLDPMISGFVTKLAEKQPCYSAAASSIRIIQRPAEFYQCLLDMIRRAEHRIFLSSLYIGSEEAELIDALKATLRQKPYLQARLHLDLNRSTRPGPGSTARLLLPLLKEFPDRLHVSLFRSPKLKGLMAKVVPPRFNEGWGTWHPKIYGADDGVLLSGANLNTSYFTDRQDRYLHFSHHRHLAQYCYGFLQASSRFSYRLLPAVLKPEDYTLHWHDSQTHPHNYEQKAGQLLSTFQETSRLGSTECLGNLDKMGDITQLRDVLVFPIIQAGQFGVREEERALSMLFHHLSGQHDNDRNRNGHYDGPLIDLTSGYFGLYRDYRDLVLQSDLRCRIISASPKANGFYGSKGVSGRIPEGYTLLEQRFMGAVRRAEREWKHDEIDWDVLRGPGVQLSEWEREGWTYHAKGIWLRPSPVADPSLTLFGSTNLNSRSANLDTELSFVIVTSSPELRRQLREEVDALRAHVRPWRGEDRRVRLGTKALVAMVGGML
ncbi:uncharacterized protein PHACADRAFT_143344 [Phanerochaete carnosa HHB-10118-sp]|uniref:CDP-diacylglycerol--glycerol-3-phosphate 3-phosphatidyltransferase n=1 Tax=Phanerochaete carnosa (strain HHB-10118-sp) TaxID=650164 RepID=K5VUN8_PHACS|nr:uncharacterized protein PHACADRAFT_143344 [Phanerochaete carnosa HHB-10118-sp]EKM55253.1 hypothetical protein PHACADRAFT_143344 [Phanerochaete carnosa HHB-10118-sp]